MEMTIREAAKIAHEINRAYCEFHGDFSQVPWEDAPDWQVSSLIFGIKEHLANPDLTPEQNHRNWMVFKEAQGWTYGPEKDLTLKRHPCMLPYEELPDEQRAKDTLFKTVIGQLKPFMFQEKLKDQRYAELRTVFLSFLTVLKQHCPQNYERDQATLRLEEAFLWAKAGIDAGMERSG